MIVHAMLSIPDFLSHMGEIAKSSKLRMNSDYLIVPRSGTANNYCQGKMTI